MPRAWAVADSGFADLFEIYRHTSFDGKGGGTLTIANEGIADTLRAIETDQDLYDLTQISLVHQRDPMVGTQVAINIAAPSLKLGFLAATFDRSEEHTSELQSLMRISYAVFCLKKKNQPQT